MKLLEIGVSRVILGTLATRRPSLLKELVAQYPDNIVVSVDSKNGYVTDHGWQKETQLETVPFCKELEAMGVKTIVYTDIAKDGMMQGLNLADYQQIKKETSLQIIASGGVSSINDIQNIQSLGLYGAIIGRALYQGSITLQEALKCSQKE